MISFHAPKESYPMSYEASQVLTELANSVATVQSNLSAKSIYRLAESHEVTTDDICELYRKEVRLSTFNTAAASLVYKVRLELAQPFSNEFYKNPETGFGSPEEDED